VTGSGCAPAKIRKIKDWTPADLPIKSADTIRSSAQFFSAPLQENHLFPRKEVVATARPGKSGTKTAMRLTARS
jgi:hypothetical protein